LAGIVVVGVQTVSNAKERNVLERDVAAERENREAARRAQVRRCDSFEGALRDACLKQPTLPTRQINKVVGTETSYDVAGAGWKLFVGLGIVLVLLGLVHVWTRSGSSAIRRRARSKGHEELGDQLRALASLRDEGLLSDEEYRYRRAQLLARYP